jgi:pyruvate/2-oxoglutarate dehydrogenase complex dihydrolipoamide acyltransferase (E2) component
MYEDDILFTDKADSAFYEGIHALIQKEVKDKTKGRIKNYEGLIKENEEIKKGEPLLEIETDKSVMTVNSPINGYLNKIIAKPMDVVPVDRDLCIIAETKDEANTDFSQGHDGEIPKMQIKDILNEYTHNKGKDNDIKRIRISPLAKSIADKENISYFKIKGTGPDGVIVKKDIINYINNNNDATVIKENKTENYLKTQIDQSDANTSNDNVEERIPFIGIRKLTAQRMAISSSTTAAVTTFAEVDMSKIKEFREYIPISYTTYVTCAVVEALKDYKILNSQLN